MLTILMILEEKLQACTEMSCQELLRKPKQKDKQQLQRQSLTRDFNSMKYFLALSKNHCMGGITETSGAIDQTTKESRDTRFLIVRNKFMYSFAFVGRCCRV